MAVEVYAGKYDFEKNLFARVSQCVAIGVVSEKNGLAHIHPNHSLGLLEEFLEQSFSGGSIYVGGGADAFVPQLGLIRGSANAERIFNYLDKNGLDKYLAETDVCMDYVRKMYVNNNVRIERL